jgi:toxin ParE1/3/4
LPKPESRAVWSSAAARDVDDIWDYYAAEASEETADRVVDLIAEAGDGVAAKPARGRSRDTLARGLRSVRSPPYLIFYRVTGTRVEIVRVLHERRDLVAALSSPS